MHYLLQEHGGILRRPLLGLVIYVCYTKPGAIAVGPTTHVNKVFTDNRTKRTTRSCLANLRKQLRKQVEYVHEESTYSNQSILVCQHHPR